MCITLLGLGVRQCQDQYKASYVGSVPSFDVFQDLYSSIAKLDISNFSQNTIQQAVDIEKFNGLKENLACERESARLLSVSVRPAGAWLSAPPFHLLGFIWHQMSLELVQSTG